MWVREMQQEKAFSLAPASLTDCSQQMDGLVRGGGGGGGEGGLGDYLLRSLFVAIPTFLVRVRIFW